MQCGEPNNPETQVGALISIPHVEKVESYINLAIQEGGTVLTGGTREMTGPPGPTPQGAFLRPTLISGLSHLSRTARE